MEKRAILIHGYGGKPDVGWFKTLREDLEDRGFIVDAPEMPDTENPQRDAWVSKVEEVVDHANEQTVIIGFSLGTITTLRYLEKMKMQELIGGVVLVSGAYEDLGTPYEHLRPFIEPEVDFEIVKKRCKAFAVIHGSDDQIVDVQLGQNLADRLGVDLQVMDGIGHGNTMKAMQEMPVTIADTAEELLHH